MNVAQTVNLVGGCGKVLHIAKLFTELLLRVGTHGNDYQTVNTCIDLLLCAGRCGKVPQKLNHLITSKW